MRSISINPTCSISTLGGSLRLMAIILITWVLSCDVGSLRGLDDILDFWGVSCEACSNNVFSSIICISIMLLSLVYKLTIVVIGAYLGLYKRLVSRWLCSFMWLWVILWSFTFLSCALLILLFSYLLFSFVFVLWRVFVLICQVHCGALPLFWPFFNNLVDVLLLHMICSSMAIYIFYPVRLDINSIHVRKKFDPLDIHILNLLCYLGIFWNHCIELLIVSVEDHVVYALFFHVCSSPEVLIANPSIVTSHHEELTMLRFLPHHECH